MLLLFLGEGLTNIEQMNAKVNRNGLVLQIDGLRVQEVTRCHVALRQLDARESPAVNKYIVVDLSSDAALQSLLKQVTLVFFRTSCIKLYRTELQRSSN
jgi:hypothetical protein